jgi:hypothetical protein
MENEPWNTQEKQNTETQFSDTEEEKTPAKNKK